MVLLHSASNASIAFGGPLLPEALTPGRRVLVQSDWIPAITSALWGVVIVLATRGRLGYDDENARGLTEEK